MPKSRSGEPLRSAIERRLCPLQVLRSTLQFTSTQRTQARLAESISSTTNNPRQSTAEIGRQGGGEYAAGDVGLQPACRHKGRPAGPAPDPGRTAPPPAKERPERFTEGAQGGA